MSPKSGCSIHLYSRVGRMYYLQGTQIESKAKLHLKVIFPYLSSLLSNCLLRQSSLMAPGTLTADNGFCLPPPPRTHRATEVFCSTQPCEAACITLRHWFKGWPLSLMKCHRKDTKHLALYMSTAQTKGERTLMNWKQEHKH